MKYILRIIFFILLIIGIYYLFATKEGNHVVVENNIKSDYDLSSIFDLKNKEINSGLYIVEGYVVKESICPPCSKNDQCKPCPRKNIIISNSSVYLDKNILSDNEVLVYNNTTLSFKLGKKYKLLVKFSKAKDTSLNKDTIELIKVI